MDPFNGCQIVSKSKKQKTATSHLIQLNTKDDHGHMALENQAFARPTSLKQSTHKISFPNAMPRYQGDNQNSKFKGQTIQCTKEKLQTMHKELKIEQH
jgi:hypothetical protein